MKFRRMRPNVLYDMRIRFVVIFEQSCSVHSLSMLTCVYFGQLWFKNIVDLPYVSVSYQKTLGKSLQPLTVSAMKPVHQGRRPVCRIGIVKQLNAQRKRPNIIP
jgi:hypothetical protein